VDVTDTLPLLPLRDVVVFPHMVIPLFVGRPKSIKALEAAMEGGQASIMLVAQKAAARTTPRRRHVRDRLRLEHPADAEAARRHREGAGRRHPARVRSKEISDNGEHFVASVPVAPQTETSPKSRRCAAP
jgi:ATP-dependent Lon protease